MTTFAAGWIIDETDDQDLPIHAHCPCTGLAWARPPTDELAESLELVAAFHECRP